MTAPAGLTRPVAGELGADAGADAERVRLVVGRLARLLRQQEPTDLTPSQLSLLHTVETGEQLRMSELAAREAIAAPTLSRLVAGLEIAGLVTRAADPEDGRSSLVTLSAPGRERIDALRARRNAFLARHLSALRPDDRATLSAALPILEALVQTARERTPTAVGTDEQGPSVGRRPDQDGMQR